MDKRPRTRPQRWERDTLPRYDQDLRRAKNESKEIRLNLAVETDFADEQCIVQGNVLEVDRFSVKLGTTKPRSGLEVWIAKAFIVGTEVLR